jgi:lipopolysaccharide transport system ATP-binding protein
MKDDVLIKVEGVSKKFCKDLKKSLKYGIQDLGGALFTKKGKKDLRPDEFWAVKDISFEVKRGECLGLIGHNGAGKSTLLKMLNGLINPDEGDIEMHGRVGALIELGAGFNPILTGRENIYNNGAILGFTTKEIDAKLERIIEFSEIRDFIDMPVQNYSSGMKVRLGFAVAAQMEPDVLIIDEVLAVGDVGFRLKCFKVIDNILPNTAIIFVSHNMSMVSRICSKILLMDEGKEKFLGKDTSKGIDLYYSRFKLGDDKVVFDDGSLELENIELLNVQLNEKDIPILKWQDDLVLYMKFKIKKPMDVPLFKIVIYDKEQRPVAMLDPNPKDSKMSIENGFLEFTVKHKNIELSKGLYSINMNIFKDKSINAILGINQSIFFQMTHEMDYYHPFLLSTTYENHKLIQ